MSQVPDWNTTTPVQAIPEIPPQGIPQPELDQQDQYSQYGPPTGFTEPQQAQYSQPQPQYGQPNQQAMVAPGGYPMPGMAPQVPPGMYFDQVSGLVLPEGATLAPVGRRIGAYFLGGLLCLVTLVIGYFIWGLVSWSKGQTPGQQLLGMRTWDTQTQAVATWGTMFKRGLCWVLVGIIPFGQIFSFVKFATGRERQALHDSWSSTIVLHDPNGVLRPVETASVS